MTSHSTDRPPEGRASFATTHWSVVLAAGAGQNTQSQEAMSRLCQTYWYPIYAFVRRAGHAPHDAEDLTQEFFARLLENQWVGDAQPERGRFRSFLLTILKRFLINEWRRLQAEKRGGRVRVVPIALDTAETRYASEPANTASPDQAFEKQWALTLLDRVLEGLRDEYAAEGKGPLFAALKPTLLGSRETQPYAELAGTLGLSEGAVKVAVHRLRARYRDLLKEEIAQTVAAPEDVAEEIRHLFRALAQR